MKLQQVHWIKEEKKWATDIDWLMNLNINLPDVYIYKKYISTCSAWRLLNMAGEQAYIEMPPAVVLIRSTNLR